MRALEIVFAIISMLNDENVGFETNHICRIHSLASSIYEDAVANKYFTMEQSVPHLLALGWNESRFSYNDDTITKNKYGLACGVFQQTDTFSNHKFTCQQLLIPNNATKEALNQLEYIKETWNGKLDKTICHYFSGRKCGDQASKDYAEKHKKARQRAVEYLEKAKDMDYSKIEQMIKENCI